MERKRNGSLSRLRSNPRLLGESWDTFRVTLEEKDEDTQYGYLHKFTAFLEHFDLTTESLYREQLENLKEAEDNPRAKGRVPNKIVEFQRYYMREKGVKTGAVQNVYRAVRLFFLSNYLTFDTNGTRVKDTETGTIPNIDPEQIEKLLEATGSYRTKAVILMARDSGLRVGDLTLLTVGQIREALTADFYTFEIRQEKGGRYANPVIGPESIGALKDWMEDREKRGIPTADDSPLFCAVKTRKDYTDRKGREVKGSNIGDQLNRSTQGVIFGQLVRKAGLGPARGEKKRPSIHSLRKFHYTYLPKGGVPLSWVNRIQGRKGEGTGGIYTRPDPEELLEFYKIAYWAISPKYGGKAEAEEILEMREDQKYQADQTMQMYEVQEAQEKKIKALEEMVRDLMEKAREK